MLPGNAVNKVDGGTMTVPAGRSGGGVGAGVDGGGGTTGIATIPPPPPPHAESNRQSGGIRELTRPVRRATNLN
jgi:hypothetical protein